jgi:nucleoid DNA-binding protein
MKSVMTKGDIVRQFAAARAFSQAAAAGSIEALLDIISLHFQEGGDRVTIQGFG